ncbi:MAG: LLM class flavin-dependent oxidoreductase [Acidimicrobiales bacterium]
MRFSVWPNVSKPWEDVLAVARHAEATGWDGVWVADHFMPNAADVSGPVLECWSVLAALAATVGRVRLGALVSGNTYRHPAVLANVAAAADRISGGRIVLGLGAGWQENEHRAYGIDFHTTAERLAMLDEACAVITSLLREDRTTFDGIHYHLVDAPLEPKPANPRLPLLIGGGGEKVTLRIAARWADEWNVWGTPDVLRHKGGVLDRHCEQIGRDPSTISRSAQALLFLSTDEAWLEERRKAPSPMPTMIGNVQQVVEQVGAYRDAGVDELIIPDFTLGSPARSRDTLDLFLTEVASNFG